MPASPWETPAFLCPKSSCRAVESEQRQLLTHPNSDKLVVNHLLGSIGGLAHLGAVPIPQLFRARRQPALMETLMKKTLTVLLAAATLAVSLTGTATDAAAGGRGGAFAAGLIGGIAAGAIVGGAIASSRPAYAVAPGPGYVVYPGYAA